jgi:predicted MFS family arabinose efflux permease
VRRTLGVPPPGRVSTSAGAGTIPHARQPPSTVPLTSGLVALMFGTRHVGMLFGVVFLSHQVGAFIGALLGGSVYEATGSYDLMWVLCIALSVAAALVHLPIRERSAAPVAPA